MMKCLPEEFSSELVLSMCDLKSHVGRKNAAKGICQHAKYEMQQKSAKKTQEAYPGTVVRGDPLI